MLRRRPQNPKEARCFDALVAKGFEPSSRGWPTFFAFKKDGAPAFVIVRRGRRLKVPQLRIATTLSAAGLRVFIWDGLELVPFVPSST